MENKEQIDGKQNKQKSTDSDWLLHTFLSSVVMATLFALVIWFFGLGKPNSLNVVITKDEVLKIVKEQIYIEAHERNFKENCKDLEQNYRNENVYPNKSEIDRRVLLGKDCSEILYPNEKYPLDK